MYKIARSFTEVRTGREFLAGQTFTEKPFDDAKLAAYLHRGWIVEVPDEAAAKTPGKATPKKKDGE